MSGGWTEGGGLRAPRGPPPIRRAQVLREVVAGVALAALAAPEVVGYARIAGMPVVTGLYTLLVPLAVFALLGSSRRLVVGADSATAAMLAAGLAGLAAQRSAEYVGLAGTLALATAGFLLLARLIRLGFLADFLSRTVLVGFLAGVGLRIALGELPGMLGVPSGGSGALAAPLGVLRGAERIDPRALALSLGVLALVAGTRRVSRNLPGPLLALGAAIVASRALGLGSAGLRLVGPVEGGLPRLGLPPVAWSWPLVQQLLPTAFGMFVVILAQSAATSRAWAARHAERVDENVDLVGLGLANVGAALSGTFVVNGSPTKTRMLERAGGGSRLAQLVGAAVVLLVLLWGAAPLALLPEAALAALVFLIGVELVDLGRMRQILRERPWEFWVALVTAVVVVLWSVEQGILLAIFLSLVAHTRHGYRPKNAVVVRSERGTWRALPMSAAAQIAPGLLIYRFTHGMYYANSELLAEQVEALVAGADPPLERFCIDCAAVDDVDFSAAETLRSLHQRLRERGVRLVLAGVSEDVRAQLDRSGIAALIGEDGFFPSIGELAGP